MLKEVLEWIVLGLLIVMNKMGIRARVSKRASFALIDNPGQGSLRFMLVEEMFGFLNFSGGRPDKGETDQDAVRREVREESGLEVEVGKLLEEGEELIFHGAVKLSYRIYAAKVIGGDFNPRLQGANFYAANEIRQFGTAGRLLGSYVERTIASR